MILGIVGSEGAKFNKGTELSARLRIRSLFIDYAPTLVVSGGCHLGGIDIWAVEEAKHYGIPTLEYLPEKRSWTYYRKRNIQIAVKADITVCLTVDKLPLSYKGMRFPYCYHCQTSQHIKSGGCWTVKYSRDKLGKKSYTIRLIQSPPLKHGDY